MIFDIHLHTRNYSGCSNIEPADLLRRAMEIGLDGIALTEHGIRWPDAKVDSLRLKTGIDDLTIVTGQEITCYNRKWRRQGDFLVFGVSQSLGASLSARELIRIVHGDGGIVIAAHPYKKSRGGDEYYGIGDAMLDLDLDGIELYHPEHDEAAVSRVRGASRRMKGISFTGGSDAHVLSAVGACTTVFHREILGEPEFVEAIRKGQVMPQRGHKGLK
jgi:predicted metal-dependent phosphoesterase TrpH